MGGWAFPNALSPIPCSASGAADAAPEVLTRIRDLLGVGSVHGPYFPKKPNEKPKWFYIAGGPTAVQVLDRLWPFLGPVKRRQAADALERYRRHPTPHVVIAALTGRPLRLRERCRNGHSLEDGYWHAGRLHCRTCRRINHRTRRARSRQR